MRWLGLLLSMLLPVAHAATPLRIAVSTGVSAPFVSEQADGRCAGLVGEVAERVAASLQRPWHCVALPRERIEAALSLGQIDAIAYYRPEWAASPEQLVFSTPLFQVRDRLLARPERASGLRRADDLRGLRIATLSGFVYPRLTPAFNRRIATRVDVDSASTALQLLSQGRVDALVLNEATWRQHVGEEPALATQAAFAPWAVAEDDIAWALHRRGHAALRQALLDALHAVASDRGFAAQRERHPGVYPPRYTRDCFAPPPAR